ncbi:MAG: nucleoside triphosphate pyrophosphohydrolase [Hyphomicrobiales bacterium]|nr:nucleoside triphosphate pyrophosphohydrolase [Hyphomicrobiales bacterium]
MSERDIGALLAIMAALRTPKTGCAWDLEQNFESIAPYTIEEAYEVADAIARRDLDDLRDELGDLLLQVVFHARMAQEQGAFDFGDIVGAICDKLTRRHPHVFGDARNLAPDEVAALWSRIKAQEKADKAARSGPSGAPSSILADVKAGRPALGRALALQAAAGAVGFDWNDARAVLDKIREEAGEVVEAMEKGDRQEIEAEIGDLLFAAVNLARHAKVDPESALRAANAKFERRFAYIEQALAEQRRKPQDAALEEMDALWEESKSRGL